MKSATTHPRSTAARKPRGVAASQHARRVPSRHIATRRRCATKISTNMPKMVKNKTSLSSTFSSQIPSQSAYHTSTASPSWHATNPKHSHLLSSSMMHTPSSSSAFSKPRFAQSIVQQSPSRSISSTSHLSAAIPSSSKSIVGGSPLTSSLLATSGLQLTHVSPAHQSSRAAMSNTPTTTHDDHLDDHDHGAFERQPPKNPQDAMTITIVDRDDEKHVMPCKSGDNLLQLMRIFQAENPKLFLEGACEMSLACSTCHVVLDDKSFNYYSGFKPATDEEEDLLDMASCLTPTSRLGCQIYLTKEVDGATIFLPKFSRNFYVDGHVPQPH